MKKKVLVLLVIILGIYIAAFFFVKSQIKKELENHPELVYEDVSLGLLGEIEIDGVSYKSKTLNFNDAQIDLNIDFLSFLNGKQKTINGVKLSHTNIEIFDQKSDSIKPSDTSSVDLIIKKLQFENVNLKLHRLEKVLEVERMNFRMSDIENFDNFDIKQLKNLNFNSLTYPINALQKIEIEAFAIKNKNGKINDLKIIPLLDKDNYSKVLKRETDLIDLSIPSLDFMIDDFSINKGDIDSLIFESVNLDSVNLQIYRDKTLPDDKSIKRSYTQQLKDLDFNFALNQLSLKNTEMVYGEKYFNDKTYALINFKDIEIELDSISNFNSKFARLKSSCKLNNDSDLKLFITYDLNGIPPNFDAKIEAQNIDAGTFSDLLKQSQKKEIEGRIQNLSTVFRSTNNLASGDFNLKASDIKVTLFNDKFKKKKIVSFLANTIISKDKDKSFQIENVQKKQTKSFWNYLWSFIKTGLKTALLK